MIFDLPRKLSQVFSAIHDERGTESPGHIPDEIILCALEKVIDGVDTKIRLVPGYKRKLWGAVEKSLLYTDQLVDQIPGLIEINCNNFVSNPYTNAFFVNPQALKSAGKQSSELKAFVSESENYNQAENCVLLCMQKIEKTVLGMGLSGDQVRRDIKQTSVSFTDHRIYSPETTEEKVRLELRCCLFNGLITNALGEVMRKRASRSRLETEQRMLNSRLRYAKSGRRSADDTLQFDVDEMGGVEEIRAVLSEVQGKLEMIELMTPAASLAEVVDTLSCPENFINVKRIFLRLDKMGIKISENAHEPGNSLNLAEVNISEQKPRVVVLAKLNLKDFSFEDNKFSFH